MDIEKSNLNNLCTRLLIDVFKQKLSEPHCLAINCDSATTGYLQSRFDYANEVKRVLVDLKRVRSLMKYEYDESFLKAEGLSKEDIIIFYQGYFLDLVHQLKDKLIKMSYLLENDIDSSEEFTIEDLKKKVRSSDQKLKKYLSAIKSKKLEDLMSKWDADDHSGQSGIQVCLRKRTGYHHFLSTLHQNQDFNEIKGLRIVLSMSGVLTTEGEKLLQEKRDKTLEDFSTVSQKQLEKTFDEIYKNIDDIALLFINELGYPLVGEGDKKVINEYLQFSNTLKIVNLTNFDAIDATHKNWINDMIELCKCRYGNDLRSIYLLGSLARGEHEEGVSDTNIYIILEKGAKEIDKESAKLLREIKNDVKVINISDFLGEEYKKDRFICTFDGILLYGKMLPHEEFPQSGSELTYLLNKDLVSEMQEIRKWCEDDTVEKGPEDLTERCQYLSSKIIHFLYGVVDANHPGNYTFSRKLRINAINKHYPENKEALSNLEMARVSNINNVSSLLAILDVFEPIVARDIEKIKKVLDKKNGVD